MNKEWKDKLEELKRVDVRTVDINSLVDIKDVHVNQELSLEERLLDFVEQIKNPYCYRCGDMVVKISYEDTDVTLEERMESYIKSLNH